MAFNPTLTNAPFMMLEHAEDLFSQARRRVLPYGPGRPDMRLIECNSHIHTMMVKAQKEFHVLREKIARFGIAGASG